MDKFLKSFFTLILATNTTLLIAKEKKAERKMLVSGSHFNRVAIINENGKELWTFKEKQEVNDSWFVKDDQNKTNYVVMSFKKGIRAVKVNFSAPKENKKEILWQYNTTNNFEIQTCQPLAKDKFLLGMSGQKQSMICILTLPDKLKKLYEIPNALNGGKHYTFRQVRLGDNDNLYYGIFKQHSAYITNFKSEKVITIPMKKVRHAPFTVVPSFENGEQFAYIGGGEDSTIIKVDEHGDKVWEINNRNLKGGKLAFVAGINVLQNGNILVANWGQMINRNVDTIIEINPKSKEIVWSLSKEKYKNAITSVQLISENGKEIYPAVK
ncbi:hypothetical protein AAEX28_13465 [Lentisphaerota bacterium WC36G]|nr:hypothetical protein LJT99_00220 [Lentisphaerae bacterium WC36]